MEFLSSKFGLLIAAAFVFYLLAFGLHLYMVVIVKKALPESEQIPYSLQLKGWNRVAREYRGFYPRSHIYPVALSCAIATILLAAAIFVIRFWQLVAGK